MGDEIQDYYRTAIEVARKAGEVIKTDFQQSKMIEVKENFADLVTKTDQHVENLTIDSFKERYPSHRFIGEESVAAGKHCELTDEPTWIIDPIDGTTNFVHGIPQTCISIGLAVNKEIVVGVIYAPVLGEMFSAIKGQGSFLNDKKLQVSAVEELKKSVVVLEGGTSRDGKILNTKMENMKSVIQNSHGVRCYGSAAINMCMVARGRCMAYMEHGIHVWDIAAGKLIVEEAGGVVLDPSGGCIDLLNRRVLAACNQSVAKQLASVITNIDMERD